MRSGAGSCTVQQTLTSEAASVLKHSLGLARRRGHAQVTPLHVAATLLASRASLLRRACIKSQHPSPNSPSPNSPSSNSPSPYHPHPPILHCRALELCFNVALNRLPTITSPASPLLPSNPSLSNALIAALKRAQAHQRRGCIEQNQQQPLLAIKVELEQLIISILDDPSVSRVMREAGFSSTAVKNNLEDCSASPVFHCGGVFSSPCSPSRATAAAADGAAPIHRDFIASATFWPAHLVNSYSSDHHAQGPVLFSPQKKHFVPFNPVKDLEPEPGFKPILEILLGKNGKKIRNTVLVGDSVSLTEGLVSELVRRIERREVPEELKSAHFIRFQFSPSSVKLMKKEEVEASLAELRRKVECSLSLPSAGGAIVYAGDLRWAVEAITISERGGVCNGGGLFRYSPVDHLVDEIGRLVGDYGSRNCRVWLMGTASYQTYMKCKMRQPSLETQWALQPVSVPSGGLGLSLHASR